MRFCIYRWDNNPTNVTFNTWVYVCEFTTAEGAEAYIKRASWITQLTLRVE